MNAPTLIVLLLIAALATLAIRHVRRKKLLFHCGGDCQSCSGACARCGARRGRSGEDSRS